MPLTNDQLISKFAPQRRMLAPQSSRLQTGQTSSTGQQSTHTNSAAQHGPSSSLPPRPPKSDAVDHRLVAGIVGAMVLIPLLLLGVNWWMGRPDPSKIAEASPSPSVSASPSTSPSPEPEESPEPTATPKVSPSPKTSPKPTVSPSPKASVSPSPGGSSSTDLNVEDIIIEDAQGGSELGSPYYAGQRVTVRAKLRNSGKQDTPTFSSSWSINGSTQCSNSNGKVKADSQASYDDVNSLTCTFWLKQGDNTFAYTVDSGNALNESNKGNNTKSKTISAQATRTDLEALEIRLYKVGTTELISAPAAGQKYTAKAVIKNVGQEKQTNVPIRWLYNGSEVKKTQLNSWLAAGATAEEAIGYEFTTASGSATLKFEVNNDNVFPETSTGNNSQTKNLNL
jgi:hypothetical protein